MATAPTTVERSTQLPASQNGSGICVQPSERDAAHPSTKTVFVSFGKAKLKLDAETIQALLCLLNGYMSQVMSGDVTALSFYAAKSYAEKAGLSEDKFCEVANAIFKENDRRRKKHPFVSGGFMP